MKYISLLSICILFVVGCANDTKTKEIANAGKVTDSALNKVNEVVAFVDATRNEMLESISTIEITEADMDNASDKDRVMLNNIEQRVKYIQNELKAQYDKAQNTKDEIAAAQQQLTSLQTKMKEGQSFEEASNGINAAILNTTSLEEGVMKSMDEFKKFKEEHEEMIKQIFIRYDKIKK